MINVAICGLGRMGSYHLGIYERLMDEGFDVCVKAICDVEKDALDGLSTATMNQASQRHISTRTYAKYTSLDEMLQNEELDAVDVVTPTFLHSECAVKVLGSGRHCMCEKPMALDEAECRAMIDAAVKNGKVLMIGHCLRFWREYIWLHDRARRRHVRRAEICVFHTRRIRGSCKQSFLARLDNNRGTGRRRAVRPAHTRLGLHTVDLFNAGIGHCARQKVFSKE